LGFKLTGCGLPFTGFGVRQPCLGFPLTGLGVRMPGQGLPLIGQGAGNKAWATRFRPGGLQPFRHLPLTGQGVGQAWASRFRPRFGLAAVPAPSSHEPGSQNRPGPPVSDPGRGLVAVLAPSPHGPGGQVARHGPSVSAPGGRPIVQLWRADGRSGAFRLRGLGGGCPGHSGPCLGPCMAGRVLQFSAPGGRSSGRGLLPDLGGSGCPDVAFRSRPRRPGRASWGLPFGPWGFRLTGRGHLNPALEAGLGRPGPSVRTFGVPPDRPWPPVPGPGGRAGQVGAFRSDLGGSACQAEAFRSDLGGSACQSTAFHFRPWKHGQ
jgi:hypothetical protein